MSYIEINKFYREVVKPEIEKSRLELINFIDTCFPGNGTGKSPDAANSVGEDIEGAELSETDSR